MIVNFARLVAGGVEIRIKVVPGSRNRIAGLLKDAIKIQVAAPPEKGKANEAVIRLLAGALGVAMREVSIVNGTASPRKTILVRGVGLAEVVAALWSLCK